MMDLPDEIIALILDYIPVKDLLNASLVSKGWLQYIAESVAFRKKVVINSNFYTIPSISKWRSYESLNIRQFKVDSDILGLLEKNDWRSVYFNIQRIKSQKDFVAIMEKIKHVKDLRVMNVAITKLNTHQKISLPDLETLVFSDVAVDTFETFITNHPSLKFLSMRFITNDIANKHSAEEYFIEFLVQNSHIRDLELYDDVIKNLFKTEVTQIVPLNLRSVSLFFCGTIKSEIQKNVELFLKSQSHLEELRMCFNAKKGEPRYIMSRRFYGNHDEVFVEIEDELKCDDVMIVFNLWNEMYSLKKLSLRFLSNFAQNEDVYTSMFKNQKANTSIKVLVIQHIGRRVPLKLIKIILSLCPNLTRLYVTDLELNLMKFCAFNLKLLKSFNYTYEKDFSINEYNTMINVNQEMNKFIKFQKEYLG